MSRLLESLKDSDSNVRRAAAEALKAVAQAAPALADRVLDPLLVALRDSNPNVRRVAAGALKVVTQAAPGVRVQVFRLLIDYDADLRGAMQGFLADPLVALAADEAKEKRDPVQFLLDHLEGQWSLMPGGDANTYAGYRSVVVRALAQWLKSDESEAKATQEDLRQKLAHMRDHDKRLHLRIAAWNVFVQAAQLRENRR